MRRGGYKCRTLEMNLQVRNQQLKKISYIYIYIYIDSYQTFGATANQKSTIDKQIRQNSNTTRKIVIKTQEERTREEGKSNKNKSKVINKMAIRTYISIIT